MKEPLRHKVCGNPVTLAVLANDVAIYIYCAVCDDIVEIGELDVAFRQDDEGIEFNKRKYAIFPMEPGEVLRVQ